MTPPLTLHTPGWNSSSLAIMYAVRYVWGNRLIITHHGYILEDVCIHLVLTSIQGIYLTRVSV